MYLVEDIEIIKNKENKFGLKNNLEGTTILEPAYDLIEKWEHSDSYYFSSGEHDIPDIPELYIIIKDKKIGFADKNGIVVEPTYDNLLDENFTYYEKLYPAFVAVKDDLYGYIDKCGKPLTDFIYKDVDFPLIGPIAHVLNKNGMNEYISLESGKTFFSNSTDKNVIASVTKTHVAMLIECKRYKVFDKTGTCIADFLNNQELNSASIRYLNEKLLMYFKETEAGCNLYKIGLVDYTGQILTELKYSDISAIIGTNSVVGTNIVGGLEELIDKNGKILITKMKNVTSWQGVDEECRLIPPLVYWNENDDPTDIDKCIQVDEKLLL